MQISVLLLLTAIQMHSTLLTQGVVIEGPSDFIYLPGLTPLPIELTCNVTGVAAWRVNNSLYSLTDLSNGTPPRHNRTGTNILVNSPVNNNTEYICVSTTNDGETRSDPAYIIIAGVPGIVPDVKVDSSTININGNNVTLTVSWGEPFTNFDPIVHYTVSCSGDNCPPNFITTDNTTRNYTFTNLTPMTNYTFSVVATNSIGSGEAGVVMINTPPVIQQVTGVNLTCELMELINQCTAMWKAVTQENITGYQVCYNGTIMTVNSSTTTLIFTAPTLSFGVFTDTIVVIVSAVRGSEVGLASHPATAVINGTSVISIVTTLASINATSGMYNITVNCTIHSRSTANQCEVMLMADNRVNITDFNGSAPITNGIATVTVNGLECEVTYTIIAGGTLNGTLIGPRSFPRMINQLCPSKNFSCLDQCPDEKCTVCIIVITTLSVTIVGGGGVQLGIIVILIYRKKKNTVGDQHVLDKTSKNTKNDTKATQTLQDMNTQVDKSKTDPPAAEKTKATQAAQDEYAQVNKSKTDPPAIKQPEGGIQYLDLDIKKGPDKYGGEEHKVDYGQVVETKQ